MKVIVIGAGIVGATIVYRLAQAGATVTCVDPRGVGTGTSSVSYGWVNACEKLGSRSYFDLNMAGRAAHLRLLEEFDGADWNPRPGVVQWTGSSAEAGGVETAPAEERLRTLLDWGYPATLIEGDALRRLEPDIAPEAYDGSPIILFPEDGWCHGASCAGSVAGAARFRLGATLVRSRVVRIVLQGGRCRGVALDDGTSLEADVVVNCAGRWLNDVVDDPALRIPLAPTAGFIAFTSPVGLQLRRGLRTPKVNLRPDGGGRIMLRAFDLDETIDREGDRVDTAALGDTLLRRAQDVLPALATARVEATRTAVRPCPADGYSAVGPIPGVEGVYAAVTHSGITLAPYIAEAVTDELVRGAVRPELAEFRPSRFFDAAG